MTEDNNQNDQPTEEQQPSDETQPQYREISKEDLEQILEDHKKWLESDGKEGARADLRRADLHEITLLKANLQKADLMEANLQKANLFEANLQHAYLRKANLEQAYLERANLQQAYLGRAKLQKTDFSNSDMSGTALKGVEGLSEANLKYANLEGATGLLGNEFAQADVTGTKLPDDIKEFKALETVEKTSQNARKIFSAMLFGCVFSWLTIATTTDSLLLTNTATSPLPILGTEIPIVWFYITAPLVLIALYLYFHFYLQGLWEGLAGLPAIFPDGKRLDERAYPWLLNRLVRRHFRLLKADRPIVAKLQELIVIILVWWVVPFTIFSFWFRYLVIHEFIGTSFHIVLLLFSIATSLSFYQLSKAFLKGDDIVPFKLKNLLHDRKSAYVTLIGFIFVLLSSYGFTNWGGDFRQKNFSIKPSDYYNIDSVEKKIASVKGAILKNRNLKNADMQEAFLVKADLRGASLNNAILTRAELKQANLNGANLEKANLSGANLQEANLTFTNLQEAHLVDANLNGADLAGANFIKSNLEKAEIINANLHSAILSFANLQNADLMNSDFYETKLNGANFDGANITSAVFGYSDLSDAKNLTVEQLCKTITLFGAKLGSGLMEQVKKSCPQLLEDPGKETEKKE